MAGERAQRLRTLAVFLRTWIWLWRIHLVADNYLVPGDPGTQYGMWQWWGVVAVVGGTQKYNKSF